MGRKRGATMGGVNKGQAIRDALAKNPDALPKDLAAELTAQGIEVTPAYVSNIKTLLKSETANPSVTSATPEPSPIASAPAPAIGISKSQAIKDALARDPAARPKDVAAELNAQGLDVTSAYVRIVKSNLKLKGKTKGKRRAPAAAAPPIASASASKAASASTAASASSAAGNGSAMVDVSALVKAKALVDQVGGIEKAQGLLAALKKLQ